MTKTILIVLAILFACSIVGCSSLGVKRLVDEGILENVRYADGHTIIYFRDYEEIRIRILPGYHTIPNRKGLMLRIYEDGIRYYFE